MLAVLPRHLCTGDAQAYFDADLATQDALARSVIRALNEQRGTTFYHTGNARFDGQSSIAIYQMAVLGLGQIVLAHPEKRAAYLPVMQRAAERLVAPATLRYAADVYGHHAVTRMGAGEGHAYIGYVNLALGMLRLVDAQTPLASVHDRLSRELAQRLFASKTGLIETYPGETWPPDVAAVAGSIGLHARATGKSLDWSSWRARFAKCAIGSGGFLVQRVRSGSCEPLDAPRGSGTAVGAYFLRFAEPNLSAQLHRALIGEGLRTLAGFGAVREYASGHQGRGDVNAGPILLGLSVGASGFGLGSARIHGDRDTFVALYRSAHLLSAPVHHDGQTTFALGGVLGNALILAMLTARAP